MTATARLQEAQAATKTVPLWVLGTSGMLTGELLRLVDNHPGLRLAGAVSRDPERELGDLHPHLAGPGRETRATIDVESAAVELREYLSIADNRAALVLGLPHGQSAQAWNTLRSMLGDAAERLFVVDLSADYRLRDPEVYARWYGKAHADPEELEHFVYGLPEVTRGEMAAAKRVAAPGCFATTLLLSSLPAASAGLLDPTGVWSYSAVTGSSGSGVVPKPGTHHPHRHGNLWAYGLDGHRHEAELRQGLASSSVAPEICFVPHSGPFARGIHLTAMLPLARPTTTEEALDCYRGFYAGEPFVEVLDEGAPDLRRVVGSNKAVLGAHVRGSTLVVLLALDNLIKGGAGQALQGLNLMLGHPEGQGLPRLGMGVV